MKYRKKPIIVEAIQWDGKNATWNKLLDDFEMDYKDWIAGPLGEGSFYLVTSEGEMKVNIGDMVIKEPFDKERKLYPCKPDIFQLTYEKVW